MKHFVLTLAAAALMFSQGAVAQNRVRNLSTETSSLQVEQVMNTDQTVQVSRYLFAGYNTLCLPMSVSAEQFAKTAPNVKVEKLAAIGQEGNTLCLYFVDCTDKGIEAGMPYLIFSPTTQYLRVKNTDANGFSADAKAVRLADNNGNQVCFSSSWNTRVTEGLYGIPAQQNVKILESVLIRTSGEQAFRPTRCGFNWEAQSPNATKLEIKHVSSSDVTAINAAKVDNASGYVYDLQGRRLNSKPAKGVIIQNGRKVAVK